MMHQHHIGLGLHRCIQQRLAGSDAADDTPHQRAPFDLQAVRAVILDARGVQETVRFFHQSGQGNGHR
ncbi:hypothetical protein D3C78_1593140 [compost metagenome]